MLIIGKKFGENVQNKVVKPPQKLFKIDTFYICSIIKQLPLQSRFEQFKTY